MTTALIVLGILFWACTGVACLVYDWTESFDLKPGSLLVCSILGSILGPIAVPLFFIPNLLKRTDFWNKVLIKGRRQW